MAKKQIVQRYDRNHDIDDLNGRVEDVLHFLNGLLVKYGPDTYMEVDHATYDYDSTVELIIAYKEEETDRELVQRLARGKKSREKRAAEKERKITAERKEFERLSKKYGG
jgi:hypothetical protein